jgi:hypothetical protein
MVQRHYQVDGKMRFLPQKIQDTQNSLGYDDYLSFLIKDTINHDGCISMDFTPHLNHLSGMNFQ